MNRLYSFFSSISPVPDGDPTALPSGLALSPADAAACTLDARRTEVFLCALRDAIAAAPRKPAEVVYAGTGPFAPLAIPLMTQLAPGDARFTLIDIHPGSVQSVKNIVATLDLGNFVRDVIAADATTYRHGRPIDVGIAEVMQRALTVEPQVAIMRNLRAQLADGGVVIPQRVTIDLVVDTFTATVFDTTDDAPRTITFPKVAGAARAMYFTTIHAYDRHVLRAYESGLTHPVIVWDLSPRKGDRVTFRYETGPKPGLRWSRA